MKEKTPLLIDMQEKTHGHEWSFDTGLFDLHYKTLDTGDYSLVGLESRVCLERKSLGDAVSTVIHDWIRFRKQLYRMAGFDHAAVVIEAGIADILDHKYESDAEPESVLGRLLSIMFDHGVPVVFAGSRPVAETFAERWLLLAAKKCGVPT